MSPPMTQTRIVTTEDIVSLRPSENELEKVKEYTAELNNLHPKKSDKSVSKSTTDGDAKPFKQTIVWWPNVAWYVGLHILAVVGLVLMVFQASWATVLWSYLLYVAGALGITAGAHRLWAHRSYKGNLPYRFLIMLFNCLALQNDVIEWARDHRCHHKWSETDADPHSSNRGMFFAHMGWLMVRKHPEVLRKGAKLDLSDLLNDPVLVFQRKYYGPLSFLCCFVIPTIVPWYFWGENIIVAYFVAGTFRYTFLLHVTWCVNSVAHWIGYKPYDQRINPKESLFTAIVAVGEGWHNYHHTFPQDYKTAEIPYFFNLTTIFIDFFSLIGWTTDLKVTPQQVIDNQKARHGGQLGHGHSH